MRHDMAAEIRHTRVIGSVVGESSHEHGLFIDFEALATNHVGGGYKVKGRSSVVALPCIIA